MTVELANSSTAELEGLSISPFLADLLSPGGTETSFFAVHDAPQTVEAAADVTPESLARLAWAVGATVTSGVVTPSFRR